MTEQEAQAAGYAAFREYRDEDVEKLFLPPIDEGAEPVQFARPWPKARLAWREGFRRAQVETQASTGETMP